MGWKTLILSASVALVGVLQAADIRHVAIT